MRKSLEKLIRKLFSIGSKHQSIIDHFIEDGRATSESDVVRQALTFYHDKIYPNYIFRLTPAAQMKAKKLEKEEEFESVSEEDYARSLKFFIVADENGNRQAMYKGLGHSARFVPLEGIKEWAEGKGAIFVQDHNQDTEPDETFLARAGVKRKMEELGLEVIED